ncbi:TATA element modulatory factor [Fasciola gigantica]|uniref:TATA element modulatory factor n=1 Tax=Fasciola gigantica TaxID=46835 RepID=A0A504Z460_FASGI|nr:TATA element modulatory factor [Fasciola gigantica]
MSWWNSLEKAGQISKLAYSALKNAQQKIDEVLDIDDNIEEESKITSEFQTQLHTGLHTSQTEPSAYHICVNDHTQVPESTPIESALGCDVFTSNSFPKSTGSHSDDETVLDKQMHLEYNLSFTNREVTTSPNLNDRSLSPVQSSDDVDSHRRTLSALNLFSAHSVKESPRTHRASGSVGDNLNSSPLGPFDAVQTLTLAFEPDTTATGSDIEVLSGCTSTNGDSGHPMVTSIAPLERTVVFQNPPDGMSRSVNPGTVDGTHTLSALPRHRRAVSASNAFHLESSRPQEEDLSFAFQRLLKNYADKKALLRIRETKILQLSRENCGLREVNATLGEQLKGRGTPQDLSELTAEFTERLAQTECRLRLVSRERDQLKLSLASAQAKLKSSKKPTDTSSSIADTVILNKRIAELERALNEKTVQVSQLMREGEQLAQFQLKGNTTIKQLRAKEKDARKSERILSEKNEQLNSQIERLRNDFRAKEDAICELTGQLEHVAKITQAQEAELQTIKVRYTHTQSSLKEKDNQIDDLNRALLDLQSRLTEAETRAGRAARSSASEQTLRESCATLREQLDAARAEANSLKRTSDERYAQWREEREYYQRLIAEANSRLESMEEHAQSAVQPALRQLESLQAHMAEQTEDWHRREIVLNQQLTECQKSALASSESERAARQQLRILETKLTELGKNNSQLQSEEKRLKEQLDVMSEKLRLACQTEKDLSSQLVSLNAERKVDEEQLGNLKVQLRQEQLAREVITRENEQVREQFRQLRLQTVQQSGGPDCTSDYPISQHSVEMEDRFSSKSETEPISEIVPPSPSTSVHRSVAVDTVESPHTIRLSKEMGSHAHLEYMQALVSLKDGELAQLRREVEQLTRAKNTLLNELATASANSERLARLTGQSTEHFATDSQMDEFQELQRRYNALLVLHGQVTEENTELRMDLADMKEMYKAQIDMLLRDQ